MRSVSDLIRRLGAVSRRRTTEIDPRKRMTSPEIRARLCGFFGVSPQEFAERADELYAALKAEIARRDAAGIR